MNTIILVINMVTFLGLVAFRDFDRENAFPLAVSYSGNSPDPQTGMIKGEPQNDIPNETLSDPKSGMIMPSAENFEKVSRAVSAAVNTVNIFQDGQVQIDPTDLTESYDNFSLTKYEAVLTGERHYKYLKFEKYWYNEEQRVRAVVSIPDSEDGQPAQEYVELVLKTMNKDYGIDITKINPTEIQQIARDVNEIGRFTCIKFLRLVWAVFSDGDTNSKGLFPQVYQMRVVDAGDLASQVDGGDDLFNPNNLNVVKSSLMKHANISNYNPNDRVDLFDKKVVVFFRPTDKKTSAMDNGHVGVGRLEAQYDSAGNFIDFTISSIEVMGTTGQSFYHDHITLNAFRAHLYFNTQSPNPVEKQIVGWFFNR